MTSRTIRTNVQVAGWAAVCGIAFMATGCASPKFSIIPGKEDGPTVGQVQEHLKCVLVRTMDDHLNPTLANAQKAAYVSHDYALWRHLADANFLTTINLTVFVNETEGFNPSINFIRPVTSTGAPIKKMIESSNGLNSPMNVTSNTFNVNLSVGGQITGMQDRNLVLNYVLDMHRLFDWMYRQDNGVWSDRAGGLIETCGIRSPTPKIWIPMPKKSSAYDLEGDLQLKDTLSTGLLALDNLPYSPITSGSASSTRAAQTASSATVAQAAGTTAFSTKVDFSLAWGVDGGPYWTLLKIKGPSGMNPLLAYARSKQDTLIATFGATCRADSLTDLTDAKFVYPPSFTANIDTKSTTFEIHVLRRRYPSTDKVPDDENTANLEGRTDISLTTYATDWSIITVVFPTDATKLSYTSVSSGTGVMSFDPLADSSKAAPAPPLENKNATISWSGYAGSTKGYYNLRGSLMDAQSGSFVGYINLEIGPRDTWKPIGNDNLKIVRLNISSNALASLISEATAGPPDYWASLPSCSNSGPFLPNGLNVLQQLGPATTSAVQQN